MSTRFQRAMVDVVKHPHDPAWLIEAIKMLARDLVAEADAMVGEPVRGVVHHITGLRLQAAPEDTRRGLPAFAAHGEITCPE